LITVKVKVSHLALSPNQIYASPNLYIKASHAEYVHHHRDHHNSNSFTKKFFAPSLSPFFLFNILCPYFPLSLPIKHPWLPCLLVQNRAIITKRVTDFFYPFVFLFIIYFIHFCCIDRNLVTIHFFCTHF